MEFAPLRGSSIERLRKTLAVNIQMEKVSAGEVVVKG